MGDTNNAQQHARNDDDIKVPSESNPAQAATSQVAGGENLAIGESDSSSVGSSRKFYRSAEKR